MIEQIKTLKHNTYFVIEVIDGFIGAGERCFDIRQNGRGNGICKFRKIEKIP